MSWQNSHLGDHIRIKHGYAFKSKYFDSSGNHIVLTPGNFFDEGGFKHRTQEKFYTIDPPEDFILEKGNLIIAMTEQAYGLLGSSALVPKDNLYLHNQRLGLVVDLNTNTLDKKFLYYLFNTYEVRSQIRATATGLKVKHTAPTRIYDVEVKLPDTSTQQKIASVLSAYEDLIANNSRRLELLEESMRLLYREWFVHLRFPGYERVKFIDGIPDGWEKKPLADVCELTMGQSPPSEYYNTDGEGLPFHQGVSDYGKRFITHRKYCTQIKRIAEPGDILFSVRAPVGRINITLDRIVIGRGLTAIRNKQSFQSFQYYQLKSQFHQEDMIGGGAIFASVTKKQLSQQMMLQPKRNIIDEFERIAIPVGQQIAILHIQNQRLVEARDILLPRLMNGSIPV